MQVFQLYENLLTDEAHQPWEKIMKVQTDTILWDALHGEVHEKKVEKPFLLGLHNMTPPGHDAAKTLKFYITNTLKKPNRVPICQFFV